MPIQTDFLRPKKQRKSQKEKKKKLLHCYKVTILNDQTCALFAFGVFSCVGSLTYICCMLPSDKIVIGRRELAWLPDFGLAEVKAKVDTGAYTSSIHVSSCREENGVLKVVFLDDKHAAFTGKEMTFTKFRTKKVKSSTGQVQERFFVFGSKIPQKWVSGV